MDGLLLEQQTLKASAQAASLLSHSYQRKQPYRYLKVVPKIAKKLKNPNIANNRQYKPLKLFLSLIAKQEIGFFKKKIN